MMHVGPSLNPAPNRREPLLVVVAMLFGCLFVLPIARTQEPSAAKGEAEKKVEEKEPPIFEQQPFDLIILDEASKNERIKVLPLPFRRPPSVRKDDLTIRLVGDDPNEYQIPWKSISNIKFYEELLLDEANRLVAASKFDEAFDYFNHLRAFSPEWPGLKESIDRYLFADARSLVVKDKNFPASLAVLEELYSRNPNYKDTSTSRPLLETISSLFDRVIKDYDDKKDYRSARLALKRMFDKYQSKRPASVDFWIAQYQKLAGEKRDEGRQLLNTQKYREAIAKVKDMKGIWPTLEGGAALEAEVASAYPIVFVGVIQRATDFDSQRLDNWSARRTGSLMRRTMVEFLGAGPEGGQYQFSWGTIEHSEDQRRLTLRLNRNAALAQPPITGYDISRRCLQLATPGSPEYNSGWASLLLSARVDSVMTVELDLRRAHVLPEAWLRVPLIPKSQDPAGGDGPFRIQAQTDVETQFANKSFQPGGRLAEIVEITFPDSQAALTALRRGDIDILDRVFPADAIRMANASSRDTAIKVVPYAHPTVHVLVPNTKNPFLDSDIFRRSLVNAIDRNKVLTEELLGGKEQTGCRVLSGPFPGSSGDADPLGYAYDETIPAWRYNPLLAKVLNLSAIRSVAAAAKARNDPEPKLTTLVLGFPGSEIARVGCQAIQAYLKVIGIEVELREFPPGITDDQNGECDLVYKEIAIWEPVTDARRMLGVGGVAPTDSFYVGDYVRELEKAQNWGDVRDRLVDIHRAVYNDVAILPLWQVVDYFAYNTRVRNVGERNVALYQNVAQWRIGTEAPAQ